MTVDELLDWALPQRGLIVPRHLRATARKRIGKRTRALGLTLDEYRQRLATDPREWSELEAMCRVTISRFYRDRAAFESIAPLLREGVRVWSAGCASGEEPYTIAILKPSAQILATDADEIVLERARRGVYPRGALRELPPELRERAFERDGDLYRIRDEFRRNVSFRCEDLRRTMPDGPFDIILCRNLAFTYFDEATQRTIAEKLLARLRPGGALVLGKGETLPSPLPPSRE